MHDIDMATVMGALDAALRRSGLDQTEFARALGTSGSRYSTYRNGSVAPTAAFLMRAIRIADQMSAAHAEHLPTAPDAARSVRTALRENRPEWALALILGVRDRILADATTRHRALDTWGIPASTGDTRWDRLLAATIRHALSAVGQTPPAWTDVRALDFVWLPVESLRFDEAQVRARTPDWLAAWNIFVSDLDLATL